MAGGTVRLERDGAIATVTLSSPGRMNALDKSMWARLGEAAKEVDADESLRCVVLRGDGDKAFAAGADIAEFHKERANSEQAREYSREGINWMAAIAGCRHPTVALEMLLEGRIWGAREAYEKGLVNRVVADAGVVEEAYATARRIADGAPLVAR